MVVEKVDVDTPENKSIIDWGMIFPYANQNSRYWLKLFYVVALTLLGCKLEYCGLMNVFTGGSQVCPRPRLVSGLVIANNAK